VFALKTIQQSIWHLGNQLGHLVVTMEQRVAKEWEEQQVNELCAFTGGIFSTK
jgi:hypothetical protein